MIGIEVFTKKKTPFDDKYHPELDESQLCTPDKISQYRSMIGSANWILTLGCFDIAYTLSTLSRYNMAPREGHFQAMIRLFGYLNNYDKGMLVIDPSVPEIRKKATISSGHNWTEFYPDASENIPEDMLAPRENQHI